MRQLVFIRGFSVGIICHILFGSLTEVRFIQPKSFSSPFYQNSVLKFPHLDGDFANLCNRWRKLNHHQIATSVYNGKDLRYTPTFAISPNAQLTQITVAPGNENTNNSETDDPQQFSLLKVFSGCTPDILDASVEHSVSLLEHLKEPLRSLSPDLDAAEWLENIENLQKQALQPKTIIGVVGNTGAGKSSVINAMLDEERLVPTNCMRACTAVVIEISYSYDEVTHRAEVEFIGEEEWERELQILFSDFLDDAHGNASYEAWNQETEVSIAYAKIKAVYPEYTKDMLQKSSVSQLLKHPDVQGVLGGKKEIIESDSAELYAKLQSYIDSKEKTTGKKELEVWPLIKVVRIYVKAAALSTGAVIVDLPGVHDSNAARAAVAEGYMKQCTGLWIVAPITRAVDDKAAKSLLGETFKRQLKMDGGYDSVTFICSKTDDISILECQESLSLESQMSALWTKSNEYNATKRKCKERLDTLKDTKAECIATLDRIDQQIETWEELKNDVENGNRVLAPPGKRRRNKISNTSGSPQKKRRSSSSDSEDDHAATETESEIDDDDEEEEEEDDDDDELRQPLTLEVVKKKLTELKTEKRDTRLQKQEIDAAMKDSRKQLLGIKEKEKSTNAEMSAMAISARNEYSRVAIQQDFAAGIKELDHEVAEETDAPNFNPEVDFRDYDEVAESLPVFCVSSRAYQKLQGRFRKEANVPGFQTIEETEIPQLQAHCKKLTEASRRRNCQRLLNGIDQLFNTLRLILSPEGVQITAEQKIARAAIVGNEYGVLDKVSLNDFLL
jgi:Dynamin family